jgi:hypothetical protein
MKLLKTSESLVMLLSGFENEGKRIEAYKDINNNWVFPEAIKTISWLSEYVPQMELIESEIDQDLTQAAWEKERIIHVIDSIVQPGIAKPTEAIDYKIELTKKLHAKRATTNQGFVTPVIWYIEPEFENEAVRVDVDYVTDQDEPIPAAQSLLHRTVRRRWKTTTGEYGAEKITIKYYRTTAEKRAEGIRRRSNIITLLGDGLGYQLINGGMTKAKAESALSNFMQLHNSAISVYREGGKGSIYADVEKDDQTTWLTPELKDYTIKTLKGL